MTIDLRGRHFLKECDFTAAEFIGLLELADHLKALPRVRPQNLDRMNIALIFEKTSTRTRSAFEVAAHRQGANVTYIDPTASQIGHKESIADTAKVLSRFFDGIEFRGAGQGIVEELAAYATVPVFNGLTDEWHPTQMLADFQTMLEHTVTSDLSEICYAYLGDARNNMGNSLLVTGALLGVDVRLAAPEQLWPESHVIELAHELAALSGARITVTEDVARATAGAEFIHTDIWVSMGEPKDVWQERIQLLSPYRVTADVMQGTGRADTKFMHCLPALHDTNTTLGAYVAAEFGMADGVEVATDVFASSANIAFDQAENRLHTIEAVMVATMGDATVSELLSQ
jgi:ornithine carbamoyltransferase